MIMTEQGFERYLRLAKKSERTIRQYLLAKKRIDSYLNGRMLTEELGLSWLAQANNNHSINRYMLRSLHYHKPEYYPNIRLPKTKTSESGVEPFTTLELEGLYNSMPRHYLGLMWLLEETGLRVSEGLGLRYSMINEEEGRIRIRGKGRRWQNKYPSRELIDYLTSRHPTGRRDSHGRLSDGFVWPHPRDARKPLYPQNFWYHLHKHTGHAHRFRHTFATRLINRGENIKVIQDLLGHRSLQSTERYAHVNETTLRKGAQKGYVDRKVE